MDAGEQTNDQTAEQRDAAAARLWRFATGVYAAPGVARACLYAQDTLGADVNLLLFAAWCASEGLALAAEDLMAAEDRCRDWREQVVLPLRRQRRLWRDQPGRASDYAAIKQLEIQAEREQLGFLAALGVNGARAASYDPKIVLTANLQTLSVHYGFAEDALQDFHNALPAL